METFLFDCLFMAVLLVLLASAGGAIGLVLYTEGVTWHAIILRAAGFLILVLVGGAGLMLFDGDHVPIPPIARHSGQ